VASWPGVGLVSRVLLNCHGGLRVALGPWAVRCERIGGRSRCGREVGLSSSSKRCTALTEAHTVWQWWNHYHSQLPEGKRALRINLDETAICAFQGGDAEGNVFIGKSVRAVLNVSHGPRRTYLTHVAFVCDDSAVQPHLPQLIIANERTISVPAGRATWCLPRQRPCPETALLLGVRWTRCIHRADACCGAGAFHRNASADPLPRCVPRTPG